MLYDINGRKMAEMSTWINIKTIIINNLSLIIIVMVIGVKNNTKLWIVLYFIITMIDYVKCDNF
jgi:hypothetical protein